MRRFAVLVVAGALVSPASATAEPSDPSISNYGQCTSGGAAEPNEGPFGPLANNPGRGHAQAHTPNQTAPGAPLADQQSEDASRFEGSMSCPV